MQRCVLMGWLGHTIHFFFPCDMNSKGQKRVFRFLFRTVIEFGRELTTRCSELGALDEFAGTKVGARPGGLVRQRLGSKKPSQGNDEGQARSRYPGCRAEGIEVGGTPSRAIVVERQRSAAAACQANDSTTSLPVSRRLRTYGEPNISTCERLKRQWTEQLDMLTAA